MIHHNSAGERKKKRSWGRRPEDLSVVGSRFGILWSRDRGFAHVPLLGRVGGGGGWAAELAQEGGWHRRLSRTGGACVVAARLAGGPYWGDLSWAWMGRPDPKERREAYCECRRLGGPPLGLRGSPVGPAARRGLMVGQLVALLGPGGLSDCWPEGKNTQDRRCAGASC
ncbi:hypothetical protein NDU88_005666 [Pleurodeles waltl]|uniref:Uncharacterized protein n=1 Tax=Pleurodeles waltl TaxID=8319 RepID=A0AAV7N6I9_PLEWA|nr:hypothetical protein NDU88_005666 [Pleurodeles waltl]